MATIEELRAAAAAAKAKLAEVALTDEEIERSKLEAEIAESETSARAALKTRREFAGKAAEAAAKAKAGGKYLARFIDLGALLPEAEESALPNGGVLVVRSPPTTPIDALAIFYREIEAKERPIPDVYMDLVCECVVNPDPLGPEGARLRMFLESSLGRGTVIPIGDQVTDLGGIRSRAIKRGRA